MLFQILLSYLQNHRKLSHFFQDSVAVLTDFNPALDAYRVGSGAEKEEHQGLTPLHEMTFGKGVEVVFKAIPSSIVQIYALLRADERGMDAMVSILVSAMTVAFTSPMISYDWDTSPYQRSMVPFAYGELRERGKLNVECRRFL